MKNNKVLIILAVILLNALVFYMVGPTLFGQTSKYDQALADARAYAEQELCSKAVECYEEALSIEDTLAVQIEMLDAYEKGMNIGEFTSSYQVFNKVGDVVEAYRDQPLAYETACEFFLRYGKYEECADALMEARDRKVHSTKLDELREQVRYQYVRRYSMYESVLPCFDGYFTVSADGAYSHLDSFGASYSSGDYTYVSSFSEGYAFAKAIHPEGGEKSFIINEDEQRQVYLDGIETSSGLGAAVNAAGESVLLLAGKAGKTYKYYDINGKEAFGDYAFAGRFRNNVAAVKDAKGNWSLINGTGAAIGNTTFVDVVLNEFDECAPKGLIIADDGSGYHLYDTTGQQIGDFVCDGAKAFVDDYAAFKNGDKWGYVDAQGKVVIDAQYDDAKSFSNGIAGVKTGTTWQFINAKNEVVIQETFEDVGYLNENGICFVMINGYWSNLEFYYTGK